MKLDAFTEAYIEAILFTESDDNGKPLDRNYDCSDFSEEAITKIKADCKKFQDENIELIVSDLAQAGHDFWLTRNGHGAGFWDGDWQESDRLTTASKRFGETYAYIGDDGLIYLS